MDKEINNQEINLSLILICIIFAIIIFMIRQCYLTDCNVILLSSLCLEIITLIFIIININKNIFYGEIIYILNFAIYYLYLHFIQ